MFMWRTSSLLAAVVWLHVQYMSALLLSHLLTLSYLPLFWINLVDVKLGICCCICSDLVIRFHVTWNSTCRCTRIVHRPAHSSEWALLSFSFLLPRPSVPPPFPLSQDSWRRVISTGVQIGIPMPCFTTALSFYDGYRHEILPANLIQVGAWNSVADLLATEISSCCYLNTGLKAMMAICPNHSNTVKIKA